MLRLSIIENSGRGTSLLDEKKYLKYQIKVFGAILDRCTFCNRYKFNKKGNTMGKELTKERVVELKSMCHKRCSDYDEECVDVKDHVSCWMGGLHLDRADGFCPLIHKDN